MIHIICLHRVPQRQMQGFVDALHANTTFFRMIMPDVWVAATYGNAHALYALLRPHTTPNDRVVVASLRPDVSGTLAEEAWDWLRAARDNGWYDDDSDKQPSSSPQSPGSAPRTPG
jgi:hypothetical protein